MGGSNGLGTGNDPNGEYGSENNTSTSVLGAFFGLIQGFGFAILGGTLVGGFLAAHGFNNAAIGFGYQSPDNQMPSIGDVFGDIIDGLNQGLNGDDSSDNTCR